MKLGTVATIRSGLVLSRKLSRELSPFRYPLLNLRAIHPDGYILPGSLEVFYATEPLRQEYLTQQGDIIIRLSIPYTAILIDANMVGACFPISAFLCLHIPAPVKRYRLAGGAWRRLRGGGSNCSQSQDRSHYTFIPWYCLAANDYL